MAEEKVAPPKEEKKKVKKGKKPHKNKPTGKKFGHYTTGAQFSRAPSCPRCGAGVFLARHKGRMHCGKCSYTEFAKL